MINSISTIFNFAHFKDCKYKASFNYENEKVVDEIRIKTPIIS